MYNTKIYVIGSSKIEHTNKNAVLAIFKIILLNLNFKILLGIVPKIFKDSEVLATINFGGEVKGPFYSNHFPFSEASVISIFTTLAFNLVSSTPNKELFL